MTKHETHAKLWIIFRGSYEIIEARHQNHLIPFKNSSEAHVRFIKKSLPNCSGRLDRANTFRGL